MNPAQEVTMKHVNILKGFCDDCICVECSSLKSGECKCSDIDCLYAKDIRECFKKWKEEYDKDVEGDENKT